jgi:hypothetical protein
MSVSIRVAVIALLLPIVGCSLTTNNPAPAAPAPVVVTPAPSTGTVVVQPAQ